MDKFNATHLTFGTGKMKSLLRQCVFLFFPPLWVGGYCCLSFGGRRAPEKTLWLATLPRDATTVPSAPNRTFILKLHLNPATPHSAEFHISSCTACERRGKKKEDKQILKWHMHAFVCTWAAFFGGMLRFFSCNKHQNVSMMVPQVPQNFWINLRQKQKFRFVGCYLKPAAASKDDHTVRHSLSFYIPQTRSNKYVIDFVSG